MNPTFPATSYTESTASVIAATADPIARQYLEYDNWLFNERTRNWSAYRSYLQYQKQQEDLRVRILKLQYERSVAQFYDQLHEQQRQKQEEQRLALEAQKAAQEQEQQKQQDEADMESYLKEIDEQHQQQWRELEPEEDDPEEWRKATEDFAKSCRAARCERQRESRRERRAFARADKAFKNILNSEQPPAEGEVSRAENYNADKPSRNVRTVGADKRKGQKFQARRKFGSGWAKQQF